MAASFSPAAANALTPCTTLHQHLPKSLADHYDRRPVTPASPYVAAYGNNPAIVVRCGVASPSQPLTGNIITVDGVDWLVNPVGTAVAWVSLKRVATIEVDIPATYDDQDAVMHDLTPAVQTVKAGKPGS